MRNNLDNQLDRLGFGEPHNVHVRTPLRYNTAAACNLIYPCSLNKAQRVSTQHLAPLSLKTYHFHDKNASGAPLARSILVHLVWDALSTIRRRAFSSSCFAQMAHFSLVLTAQPGNIDGRLIYWWLIR